MSRRSRTLLALIAGLLAVTVSLSSCAGLAAFGETVNRALSGVSATMTTYNQYGIKIDTVRGTSLHFARDERFDTSNSDGTSKNDSQVLLISIGSSHVSHVGSSMIVAQDGLTDIMAQTKTTVNITNAQPGHPWLNDFIEVNRNLWKGKAKTIMIRSQDGTPIAIFAGSEVELFPTDVPKSTFFRVDGMYLLVYRSDYTVYDTDLL